MWAILTDKQKPKCTETDFSVDKDIVTYETREVVKKTGEGDEDFIVINKVVETSRKNRQDYINSFSSEVGILNILKKVALTGDDPYNNEYIEQRKGGQYIDATALPSNKTDAFKAVEHGVNVFDSLPEELKGKLSMEKFVEEFGQEAFDKYIEKVIAGLKGEAKAEPVKEEKEGKKDE